MRRALTLVEVLAATALLAVIAGACVPFLTQANRALRPDETPIAVQELAVAVDVLLDGAMEPASGLDRDAQTTFAWPDAPDREPIAVRRLVARLPAVSADDAPSPHEWIVFSCGGTSVYRWAAVDDEATPGDDDEEEP